LSLMNKGTITIPGRKISHIPTTVDRCGRFAARR
jgi:hypothetical protein